MNTRYLFGLPFASLHVQEKEIEFLIDTGFNGSLLLPLELIQKHHLLKMGKVEYVLADGTISEAEVFEAEINWLSHKRKVPVVSSDANFALLGMELLSHAKTILHPERNILTIEPVI